MYMLEQNNDSILSFISANNETGFLHLYHFEFSLERQNFLQFSKNVLKCISKTRTQLTSGDWVVESRENVSVDQLNGLVYFVAYKNPIESQL